MRKTIIFLVIFSFFTKAKAQVIVGDTLPTFTLFDISGKEVSDTTFNQKFLLIDFWASWCAPCRAGNKKLVKLYADLDTDKVEIVGISLDSDQSKWLKAVEKDKIKFTQLIDAGGFDAKTALLFGVEKLPSQFLFDNQGILVAINPTEEELIHFLKKN